MKLGVRKLFKILAPGNSLRKRTAYSLALVRLILAPVILLGAYYLFRMSWIVDRIVNVDAPAATLAQQASIEISEARRAGLNFLLLRDKKYLATNRESIDKTQQIFDHIRRLEPDEQSLIQQASEALNLYRQRFATAAYAFEKSGQAPTDHVRAVIRAYEADLDNLLRRSKHSKRDELVEELRKRVASFDAKISEAAQEGNPKLQRITEDLQTSSGEILQQASALETVNWDRVQKDHAEAGHLIYQAEWALSIVSAITFLVSVWVTFVLPRQVVKPLLQLKEAIDQAAEGNYEIDFGVQGKGEIVELVESLRHFFAVLRAGAPHGVPDSPNRANEV
jgi:nitrogen fixation/metabolism regulation signal transduction histidine kinase